MAMSSRGAQRRSDLDAPNAMRPPGLYLHLPFCSAICPYCDFSVLTGTAERRREFAERLRDEVRLWSDAPPPGGPIDSIYLGGGTPSLLTADLLASILDEARVRLPIAADAWLSMEANPEDVNAESAASWRALGVRTLTLGIQSFDDAALRFLGRRHDAGAARRAVETALAAGFDVVGGDLIYGLPDQAPASWERDLAAVSELAPHHVSCYQLTIHQGTPFGFRRERGRLHELPENGQATLFRLTHERLAAAGWTAYEVSNFARGDSQRSRHNAKYWAHAPYLGLGPSAHSFDGAMRWWNHRKLGDWERAVATACRPIAGEERLSPEQLALEHVMLGLRTVEGIDLDRLRGLGFDLVGANRARLDRLAAERLVRLEGERIVPTLDGWAVADGIAASLRLEPPSPAR
jgi:putative oxygen-independent coproporphyrinogen III oxidase